MLLLKFDDILTIDDVNKHGKTVYKTKNRGILIDFNKNIVVQKKLHGNLINTKIFACILRQKFVKILPFVL
jgi:hypothetical protein